MLTDVESCLWLSCKITQNAKLKRVALLTGASALLDDQRAREEALDVLDGHAGPERRGAATPRGAHVWFAVDIYIYIYIYIYICIGRRIGRSTPPLFLCRQVGSEVPLELRKPRTASLQENLLFLFAEPLVEPLSFRAPY